ncbi:MAG: ABC transporter substrate-binding protein [Candidatus Promineifilaceae bacterium]|nr:ABC transporter substrate-binding protein [Candidatus Promineifilaceae bacterium]
MPQRTLLLALLLSVVLVACNGEQAAPADDATPTEQSTAAQAGADQPAAELEQVRLPMGFIPDPQYAPFYVAAERGYYAEAGFEIEFDYSFETDGIALVGAGELPFAIVSGEQVILARAQELPVVYVMEWFQRFPIAVVAKAESGISEPADLVGRSVGLPALFGASYVGYSGLLSANEIAPETVDAEEIGFTQVESLLTDQVEAVVGYVNNEPIQLTEQGEEVNVIYVADSVDMVANGLITNETMIAEQPQKVQAFVDATLRGLSDTLANPQEAYEISKNYVEGLDDSRLPVLEASLPLWQAETPGLTEPEAWATTQEVLLEVGFLDEPLSDLDAAYTNRFVLAARE